MGRMAKSDFCMRPIVQIRTTARKRGRDNTKAPPGRSQVALEIRRGYAPFYFSVTIAVNASSVPPRVHSMVPFSNSWIQPD